MVRPCFSPHPQLWENSDIQPNTRVAAMAQFYTHEYHKRFPATIYDF